MLLALLLKTLLWDPKTINANPPKPIPAYQTWLFWLGVAVLIMVALTFVPVTAAPLSLTTVWFPVLLPELYILKHLLMGGGGGGSSYSDTYYSPSPSPYSPYYTPSTSTMSAGSSASPFVTPEFSPGSSPIQTLGGIGSAVSPRKPMLTLGAGGGSPYSPM